jgi:DNA-binding FadR family transcriptional regulator
MVEDWCVRRLTGNILGLTDKLTEILAEQKAVLDDPVMFIECDRHFHRTIVQASGNPTVATFYESLRERQMRMGLQAVVTAEDRAATVLEEHTAIVEAIRSGDADQAAAAVARHLESTWGTLVSPGPGDLGSASSGFELPR